MTFIEDVHESSLQISIGDYSDPFITGLCHCKCRKIEFQVESKMTDRSKEIDLK